MKLLTKDLRKFKSISGSIRQNSSLPILSYLKFDNGIITKNNLESFVEMESDFKGSCLIDENILMGIVSSTSADEIDVTIKETSVLLKYGGAKTTSPTDNVSGFPKNTTPGKEEIEITQEIISEIKTAFLFTEDNPVFPYSGVVFLGNGIVAACNNFIAYTKKIDESFPKTIITKQAGDIIKNFTSLFFTENDSYQFFSSGIFKFGFIKKDTKFVDMRVFSNVSGSGPFKVNKKEIIEFCDICNIISAGRPVLANIKKDTLSMVDAAYEIDQVNKISTVMDEFCFNPSLMARVLKSVPGDMVDFTRSKDKYYITGEHGFVALIQEMIKN